MRHAVYVYAFEMILMNYLITMMCYLKNCINLVAILLIAGKEYAPTAKKIYS